MISISMQMKRSWFPMRYYRRYQRPESGCFYFINIKFSGTYRQGKQSPNIIQPFVSISCSTWLSVGENLLFKGWFTLTSGKPLVSSHQETGTCLGLLVSSRFSLGQQTKQFLEKIYGKIKARCLLFQQDIKCSSQPNLLRKKHQLSFTVPL